MEDAFHDPGQQRIREPVKEPDQGAFGGIFGWR